MQTATETSLVLASIGLGEVEMVLILATSLVLLATGRLDGFGRGLRRGIFEFRKAARRVTDEIDGEASEAGRSAGGIYGKAATEVLTPDNHVTELYDPSVFQDEQQTRRRRRFELTAFMRLWRWLRQFVRGKD
jgi:Sec-independent protein translocase protein TatA